MITYIIRLLWAIFWIFMVHIFAIIQTIWYLLVDFSQLKKVWEDYSLTVSSDYLEEINWIVWNEEGEWKSLFH